MHELLDLPGRCLRAYCVEIGDGDVRPIPRKSECDRFTDPPGRAGDECYLSF
jgi:hypothetical protein